MPYTTAEIRAAIARIPRVKLANIPTPLQPLQRFSAALGGPAIYMKRDDLTGLALGGNKTRNLEFRMAEVVATGADTIVFGVEISSNSARQTTAAANVLGLKTELFLRGSRQTPVQGNLLMDYILGANVHLVDGSAAAMQQAIEERLASLRAEGRKPFYMNAGKMFRAGSCLAYVESLLETVEQIEAFGGGPDHVYMAAGKNSKGQAGLILGRALLGANFAITCIGAMAADGDVTHDVARSAVETAHLLGLECSVNVGDVHWLPDFVGERYGIPTPAGLEAIHLLARTEGILLDPVYTGKAMAGLIQHVREDRFRPTDRVVFVHTGGQPGLFSHAEALLESLPEGELTKGVV